MDATVLNPLPFQIDADATLARMRVRPGSRVETEVLDLIAEARSIARPKAMCRIGFIDAQEPDAVVIDGIRFTSRVLRVNLDGLQRVFAYFCTAGRELDAWAQEQEDMLARFYADAINEAVLGSASAALEAYLCETYGVPQLARMNPGSLGDWPLSQQRPLLALVGDVTGEIGVELTPSLLMTPAKSVSGIFYATEETFASCQLCPREECPNRRAPYDPELFERKYRASPDEGREADGRGSA
ncbi:MAG: Vitamin B12 dependent methionine synthase, activation domain [Chloroflexi bacterium ADurb.Bin325]|nr:MAG: Vitamin B12 dependent methionine synthase, activation domain [Chloroflexi bacterium ADurb.Bin325]